VELDPDFKTNWPIRQGDVFGFWDWRNRSPLSRFGMVITADCDIENGQPDQEIIYLRIVAQFDYVDIFWSRAKLVAAREQALRDLVPQINRLRREHAPNAEPLDPSTILSWLASSTPEDIADAIQVIDESRVKLVRSLARTRNTVQLASAPAGTSCLDRLLKLRNQDRGDVLKQATNDLRSPRDEIFFFTALTDRDDVCGYYVLLDRFGAICRNQISDSIDAVRRGEKSAYRFGSLSKTYKYAVAQRFAFLFQKIGLPSEYNERLNSSLARMNNTQLGTIEVTKND
jgi:hypothetical protein